MFFRGLILFNKVFFMKHKIFNVTVSLILCFLLVVSAVPLSALALPDESFGDINGDGKISSMDYIRLRLGLINNSFFATGIADLNSDGSINAMDYIMLRLGLLGAKKFEKPEGKEIYSSVSTGVSYTIEGTTVGSSYLDSNNELTDGVYAGNSDFMDEDFVGLNRGTPIITLNLGNKGTEVSGFEVSFLSVDTAGIAPPDSIEVSYSNDKSRWTSLGEMELDPSIKINTDKATLTVEQPISAKYVRFEFTVSEPWLFLDEICVQKHTLSTDIREYSDLIYTAMLDSLNEAQRQAQINAVKTNVSKDMSFELVSRSKGCSYTLSSKSFPISAFSDNGSMLTDGQSATSYADEGWVSFDGTRQNSVTVDLGKEYNDISHFAITVLNYEALNIYSPSYIDYQVSSNGNTWYSIHRQYAPMSNSNRGYTFVFEPDYCVKARYVRFTMGISHKDTVLVSEVSASSRSVSPEDTGFYPAVKHDTTNSGPWETPSTAEENLLFGKQAQIAPHFNFNSAIIAGENSTIDKATVLTNGKEPVTTDYSNSAWFHCYGADGRYFYFDLGHVSALSSFKFSYLVDNTYGIYPSNVEIMLSEDAKTWYKVGAHSPASPRDAARNTYTVELDAPVKARYVCFSMTIKIHLFIGELYAYGTKSTAGAATLSGKYPVFETNSLNGSYQAPSPDVLKGSQDVCLVYYNNSVRNEAYFLPHVGYIKDGVIKDTMFDSFLFLPNPTNLGAGGTPDGASVMSEWITLQDKLFIANQNLDALNKAAGKVKDALGLKDYKYKFTVTIPHPDKSVRQFGDYDGDGVSESLATVQGRIDAVKWYAERFHSIYDPEKYPNLEFAGWYWFHESIDDDSSDNDDPPTLKGISDYLHSIGDQIFWIPYFMATGFKEWKDYGFDSVCMQPNYAFNAEITSDRLADAAKIIQKYNMCIEIEIDGRAMSNAQYFNKYLDYLGKGIEYGYMENSIHMYYESGGLFATAYKSEGYGMLIYDYTYQFIKHTLDDNLCELKDGKIVTIGGLGTNHKMISQTQAQTATLILEQAPNHGTVTLNDDGTLLYVPNKDYKGTDSFKVSAQNFIGKSEPVTVTVQVN